MSQLFDELTEVVDIGEWCESQGLEMRNTRGASGEQLWLKDCPLCGASKWKVYLNAESGKGNCFTCQSTFTKLGFIHANLGTDWRGTIKAAAEFARTMSWRPRRVVPVAVDHGTIELPASLALPTAGGQNSAYLEARGIDGDLARYFGLRLCVDGWWRYAKEDGSRSGQNFGGRVIIPVYDLDGDLRTFQGRDVTGTSDTRYLFPKGLPGTGRYLYNGQNLGRASKRAVLGEGAFDAFALKVALDADPALRDVHALASFGKHLSGGHPQGLDQVGALATLRERGLEELTIMWDGEPKALTAALDAAKLVVGVGLRCRVARLPPGKDPGEVDAAEVRAAFLSAAAYSPTLAARWRLSNPYGSTAGFRMDSFAT